MNTSTMITNDMESVEQLVIETKKMSKEQRQLTLVFMQGMIIQSELNKQ